MNKKNLKLIMELIFIFILPIAFMLISVKSEVVNTYDENGNLLTTEKIFDFSEDTILRDYNDNITYVNKIHYNQLLKNNRLLQNRDDWFIYNITNSSVNNGFIVNDIQDNTNSSSQLYQLNVNNAKLYDKIYIRYDIESDISYDLRISIGYYLQRDNLGNKTDEFIITLNSNTISEFSFYLNYNGLQSGNVKISNVYLINLTSAFGVGNEPSSVDQVNSYFNFNNDYGYTLNYVIDYYSNSIISYDYVYNYTWYSKLFNELYNDLQINNNIVLKLITTYIILLVIMFLVWHLLYRFIDFMVHLFDRKE